MIDKKDVLSISKEIEKFEYEREKLIKQSRDILRNSKKAIYLVHRNELTEADSVIKSVERQVNAVKKGVNPKLNFIGAYSAAVQEYVEAKCYYTFVKTKKIPGRMDVHFEDYLLGLCDLTGESLRSHWRALEKSCCLCDKKGICRCP